MKTADVLILIANTLSASSALIGAYYWLKSTATNLPEIDKSTRRPLGPVGLCELNATLVESARANKTAAIWTGVAAGAMAIAQAISIYQSISLSGS